MGAVDRTGAFERALLAMDRVGARQTLLAAAEEADNALAVAASVVAPALEHIGDDWEHGTVSLAQLYMAGRIAESIVGELLSRALRVREVVSRLALPALRPVVIVGGAPFRLDPELWAEVGADATGRNSAEAVELVDRFTGGAPARSFAPRTSGIAPSWTRPATPSWWWTCVASSSRPTAKRCA